MSRRASQEEDGGEDHVSLCSMDSSLSQVRHGGEVGKGVVMVQVRTWEVTEGVLFQQKDPISGGLLVGYNWLGVHSSHFTIVPVATCNTQLVIV